MKSCCGHDCSRCVTYIATQNDDDALREQSQRFYKEEFGQNIPVEKFNCSGCRSHSIFAPGHDCPFRKCCRQRNIAACSQCPDHPCETLSKYQAKYVNKCNQI